MGAIVSAAVIAGLMAFVSQRYNAPGPLAAEAVVLVPRGATLDKVTALLSDARAIDRPRIFRFAARLSGAARLLQAGEYAIPPGASMRDIVELMLAGRTMVRAFTVPEGLTNLQVAALIDGNEFLSGELGGMPLEGHLLPETYHFKRGEARREIAARMTGAMDELLAELWPGRAADLPLAGPGEALVLASMVEKETAIHAERGHIAGVFHNRLKRNMRLQSDPTVVYDLTQGKGPLGRPLSKRDLDKPGPSNTYLIRGLPPQPIANPGRAALVAVLHPLKTEDLYFVADGNGGHAFAKTHAEHLVNVRRWRRQKARSK